MRKLGLSFLVTGVLGQLSALLWTYTSTAPTCQNNVNNSYAQQKVTKFEQLLDDAANKVATVLSTQHSDELAPFAKGGSHITDSTEVDAAQSLVEKPDESPELTLPSLPTQSYKWTIILSGLITFTGLLLALFARKKNVDPQWHVFRTVPGSQITLERPCLTCGGFISHVKRETSKPSSGLWVVEIALNTPSRHRAKKAIQQLELPVARKEHNFVVIGPYNQKQDAIRVVKELSQSHGVRGWLMAGN
ncbi:SPOR domain-containing protein [Pseudomonas sp. REP124]|uniref:SPOR domain-containing protein n=1 Tax=Pseudomonas sp. REP124 TaxID=2875731 RepID=UPI001CC91559|nr:SPOR domain-containing protein [Pseudomonas sp. REP124]MBZ9782857.1 SPOR domain-containing protein [Pseudomonas sp. REP124]